MNLTLSAEDRVIEDARIWAKDHGTSINSLVRDYLSGLGRRQERDDAAARFIRNAHEGAGRSDPKASFSRQDIYKGSRFGNAD